MLARTVSEALFERFDGPEQFTLQVIDEFTIADDEEVDEPTRNHDAIEHGKSNAIARLGRNHGSIHEITGSVKNDERWVVQENSDQHQSIFCQQHRYVDEVRDARQACQVCDDDTFEGTAVECSHCFQRGMMFESALGAVCARVDIAAVGAP